MANDSIDIIEPLELHPTDTPRGCAYYNPKILTDCQQLKLNETKLYVIKSDHRYLRKHPEVRAFVALITRHVLTRRPRRDIPTLIKEFFDRPRYDIEYDVDEYLKKRPQRHDDSDGSEEEGEEKAMEEEFAADYRKYLRSIDLPTGEGTRRGKIFPAEEKSTTTGTDEFVKDILLECVHRLPSTSSASKMHEISPQTPWKSRLTTSTVEFTPFTSWHGEDSSGILPFQKRSKNSKSWVSIFSSGDKEAEAKYRGSLSRRSSKGSKHHSTSKVTIEESAVIREEEPGAVLMEKSQEKTAPSEPSVHTGFDNYDPDADDDQDQEQTEEG